MKLYSYKKGFLDYFLVMGCDDNLEFPLLVNEVKKEFELSDEEVSCITRMSDRYDSYDLALAYFKLNGPGYFTKLYSSTSFQLIFSGHKYAEFKQFKSRQKKIDELLLGN